MKHALNLAVLLLCSFGVFAQVNFQPFSFDKALAKAQLEGKLLLVQFEASDCDRCNDVANKAFADKALGAKVEASFVCVKISAESPERSRVATLLQLDPNKAFGTFFLGGDKTVLQAFPRSSTLPSQYQAQVDIALNNAGESLKISQLEQEYRKGNKSVGFLELLLQKKQLLHQPTDSLLEEYANLLPGDSLYSIRTLRFLASMAPVLNSKASILLRRDSALFARAWYSLPLQQRVQLNGLIINKSMTGAVAQKDERYAALVAAFARNTYPGQTAAADRAYDQAMLRFYERTADTAHYFEKAVPYYERYYLSVDPATVLRADSLSRAKMLNLAPRRDTVINGRATQVASITYRPLAQNLTNELNSGAWFVLNHSMDPRMLAHATQWVERGLEYYESPDAMDTYAQLLYKQHQREKAVAQETRAIELLKKRGLSARAQESALAKMH
jgi:hypothetical protein